MSDVCGSRRFLLKVVLAGKSHWMNSARQGFGSIQASGIPDSVLEDMWVYFLHQAGPANREHLKAELGLLLEQQDQEQAHQRNTEFDIVRADGALMDVGGRAH